MALIKQTEHDMGQDASNIGLGSGEADSMISSIA
jgi:hypothetical protein